MLYNAQYRGVIYGTFISKYWKIWCKESNLFCQPGYLDRKCILKFTDKLLSK